jgi:hypothetical protein
MCSCRAIGPPQRRPSTEDAVQGRRQGGWAAMPAAPACEPSAQHIGIAGSRSMRSVVLALLDAAEIAGARRGEGATWRS